MDPVTALGIATTALEFVHIALGILRCCREIRDSSESATKSNHHLEEGTRAALELQQKASSTSDKTFRGHRRAATLVQRCVQDSEELIKLLEYVRDAEGKAKGKQANAARLVFREMKQRKSIERLENSLKENERKLNEVVVQRIDANVVGKI